MRGFFALYYIDTDGETGLGILWRILLLWGDAYCVFPGAGRLFLYKIDFTAESYNLLV